MATTSTETIMSGRARFNALAVLSAHERSDFAAALEKLPEHATGSS